MRETEMETGEMTRREFVKAAGLLVCAAVIGFTALTAGCGYRTAPVIRADAYSVEGNTVSVILGKVPELSTVGGSASIVDDSEQIYLIIAKTAEDSFVVASNSCTHRGKALGYDHETGLFICASGKSEFGLDGIVVRGPAEKSLRIYNWDLEEGGLIIDLAR